MDQEERSASARNNACTESESVSSSRPSDSDADAEIEIIGGGGIMEDGIDVEAAPLLQQSSPAPASTSTRSGSQSNIYNGQKKQCSSIPVRILKSLIAIYSDQSGSCHNLTSGLSIVFVSGAILGTLMPKNPSLPHAWYRTLSSMVGYTYFVSWSISYYPQIITIAQRRSIEGLSTDASILAVVNYTSYAIYNACLFWSETIREEFKNKNGDESEITVQSNDVAFAIHALFLTLVLLVQILYHGGFQTYPISTGTKIITAVVGILCMVYVVLIEFGGGQWQWLDFINLMGTIKLILTILTYLPQLYLNHTRKSTVGWNIWQVVFDFTGGVLSLLQLVWDSIDLDDLYHGIFGNWAKLVLSLITLICDGAFFAQHVIYNDEEDESSLPNSEAEDNDLSTTSTCGYVSLSEAQGSEVDPLTDRLNE